MPFEDPGAAIRDNAVARVQGREGGARGAAQRVPTRCGRDARTPPRSRVVESGLRFVGGVLEGAGEALWDLLTMSPFSAVNMIRDPGSLATGDLTPEELMAKYGLVAGDGGRACRRAPGRPGELRQGARQGAARLGHLGRRPGPGPRPPRAGRDRRGGDGRRRHCRHPRGGRDRRRRRRDVRPEPDGRPGGSRPARQPRTTSTILATWAGSTTSATSVRRRASRPTARSTRARSRRPPTARTSGPAGPTASAARRSRAGTPRRAGARPSSS